MPRDESAVRIYATGFDHPAFVRSLRGKLEARCRVLAGQIAEGNAIDWADYKRRIGVLQGLHEALGICEEVEKQLD